VISIVEVIRHVQPISSRSRCLRRFPIPVGLDLCADKGKVEVSVPGRQDGRERGQFPTDSKARSQGGLAIPVQDDLPARRSREDHYRQEWYQRRSDREYNAKRDGALEIRQAKYLNNIVERDHQAIKRQVRTMLGFQPFSPAAVTLAGIELTHMIRKGQLKAAACGCG
jgi:hypothetical protein